MFYTQHVSLHKVVCLMFKIMVLFIFLLLYNLFSTRSWRCQLCWRKINKKKLYNYTLLLVKLCFRCIKLKGNVIISCNHLYSVYPFWNTLRFTADADIKVEFHQTSRNLITRFFTPGVLQRAGIVKLLWSEFHNDFVSTFSFHLNNEWSIEIKTTTSY